MSSLASDHPRERYTRGAVPAIALVSLLAFGVYLAYGCVRSPGIPRPHNVLQLWCGGPDAGVLFLGVAGGLAAHHANRPRLADAVTTQKPHLFILAVVVTACRAPLRSAVWVAPFFSVCLVLERSARNRAVGAPLCAGTGR